MKDEQAQMATNTAPSVPTTTSSSSAKKEASGFDGGVFGKGKYKLWALAAIILLAFWSMFTGSVTLKWSAGNLNHVSPELDPNFHDDLDILEVEERERKVRHMWNMYTHSSSVRLPSFWQAAFRAAYEDLASEVPATRNAAISEIAKMSLHSSHLYDVEFESPPVDSSENIHREPEKRHKHQHSGKLGKKRRRN